jgi:hypothetical protein
MVILLVSPRWTLCSQPSVVPLATKQITLNEPSEVELEITGESSGTSWEYKDREAAAVLIEVDGHYNQDLLLFAGEKPFIYRVSLGMLPAGKHQIAAKLNRARSASQAGGAIIQRLQPIVRYARQMKADDWLALTNSPVLYQRPNTVDRFSDIPILMYYEVFHPTADELLVRYTTIFTNEDGGTPSAALMARWGRASDIEWVYEFKSRDGKIIEEKYQGVSHATKVFRGQRINGTHPVLGVASDNNNFSDELQSPVKFALAPVQADLTTATRESLMDLNPWSYRLVAEELVREGKIKTILTDPDTIADPREYLYVDVHAKQNGAAISVEVIGQNQGVMAQSDLGDPRLRIDRGGNFRTAIRMNSKLLIQSVTVRCFSNDGRACEDVAVMRVSALSRDFKPISLRINTLPKQTIKAGEAFEVAVVQTTGQKVGW